VANEFFDGRLPTEVAVPASLRGEATARYAVRKFDLTLGNRTVKVFCTVKRKGLFGNIYTEGIDLNTSNTSPTVEIKRA
jgi:hypothetical protein